MHCLDIKHLRLFKIFHIFIVKKDPEKNTNKLSNKIALYCGKPRKLMAEYNTELFSVSTHLPLSIFYE